MAAAAADGEGQEEDVEVGTHHGQRDAWTSQNSWLS